MLGNRVTDLVSGGNCTNGVAAEVNVQTVEADAQLH